MPKIDMSEYDPKKEYPPKTEFVLNDKPPEVPIPEFLKKKIKKEMIPLVNRLVVFLYSFLRKGWGRCERILYSYQRCGYPGTIMAGRTHREGHSNNPVPD